MFNILLTETHTYTFGNKVIHSHMRSMTMTSKLNWIIDLNNFLTDRFALFMNC